MEFRTVADVEAAIARMLPRIPHDVDLVVGLPRSGLLPASLIALYLNVTMADLDSFCSGRILAVGSSDRRKRGVSNVGDAKTILLVDDSCFTGNQIQIAKARIANHMQASARLVTLAIYVTRESKQCVDLYAEEVAWPRMFSWNFIHHPYLAQACLDIDGVICRDPAESENDDGPRYDHFLRTAAPLWVPSVRVGWLVTSRLGKYRSQTEAWLKALNVDYGELIMLEDVTAEQRRALALHSAFKAKVYKGLDSQLFIESSAKQAAAIASASCKTVFCTENFRVYEPSVAEVFMDVSARVAPAPFGKFMRRIARAIHRRVLHKA